MVDGFHTQLVLKQERKSMTLEERKQSLIQQGNQLQQQLRQAAGQRQQLNNIILDLERKILSINANIALLDELLAESDKVEKPSAEKPQKPSKKR